MFAPGDSAEASRLQYGLRSDGSVLLPGGKYFRDQSKLVKYLRDNPGYVYKNRQFIKSIAGGRFFSLAGYHLASDGRRMAQYEGVPGAGQGKQVRFWTDDPNEAAHLKRGADNTQVITTREAPAGSPAAPSGHPPAKGETVIGGDTPSARPISDGDAITPPAKSRGTSAVNTNADTLGLTDGGAGAALAAILAQASKLSSQSVKPTLTPNILDQYLGSSDPLTQSTQAANMAYDAQIKVLQDQINRLSGDNTAGINSDLDKYWGMVQNENQLAKQSNQDLLDKNTAELQGATQGFIGAAGGAAEPGTTSVAQQGVINDAALRSQAAAENSFEGNVGNFFSQAGASQKAQIAAELAQQRADLASQLASVTGEKGMYQSQTFNDLSNQNAQTMLDLNNDLYSQRKDASDTAWNRLLGLGNLVGQASLIPQQVQQGKLATAQGIEDWKRSVILNAQERAQLKQFQDTYGNGEQFPFTQLDPGTRAKLASSLMTNLLGP